MPQSTPREVPVPNEMPGLAGRDLASAVLTGMAKPAVLVAAWAAVTEVAS